MVVCTTNGITIAPMPTHAHPVRAMDRQPDRASGPWLSHVRGRPARSFGLTTERAMWRRWRISGPGWRMRAGRVRVWMRCW